MNKKIYNEVMSGKSDNNIKFNDFRNLIVDLGFTFTRQSGSHVQYYHSEKAKGYQVRQLRNIIIKHGL